MSFKKLTILFVLCFAFSSVKSQELFNGNWGRLFFDNNGECETSFSMTLKQNGNVIKGRHIRTLLYTLLMDEMEDSINGIVVDDSVAIVTVKSGRSAKTLGKAKLELI
ncbi:MAG: hypothetical protein R3Y26_09140 [Rikenellaceae bacterium]